jgi:hypothetical protein
VPTSVPLTRVYDLEYFSSNQCFLYIGDVWVDEVTSMQYVRQQQKTPLYGYASQLFDATSAGHVLVSGSFSINFKEQGYLWAVLRRWHSLDSKMLDIKGYRDPASAKKARALVMNKRGADPFNSTGGRPVVGSNGTKISRATIESITKGDASKTDRDKFYKSLAGYSSFDVGSPQDRTFEDIVEAFEDEVWNTADNADLLNEARNPDNVLFDNFDAYVVFGNYSNPKSNHTVQKIIGIRLTSQGKTIMMNDQPIQEQYSFIARSLA